MSSLKDCAKKKSFQDILTAQVKVFYDLNFLNFAPVVDGYFMPGKSGRLQNCLLHKQDEYMTQDQWDHGAPKEPKNPLRANVYCFL